MVLANLGDNKKLLFTVTEPPPPKVRISRICPAPFSIFTFSVFGIQRIVPSDSTCYPVGLSATLGRTPESCSLTNHLSHAAEVICISICSHPEHPGDRLIGLRGCRFGSGFDDPLSDKAKIVIQMSPEAGINQVPIEDLTPEQASHIIHSHRKVRYGMTIPSISSFPRLISMAREQDPSARVP